MLFNMEPVRCIMNSDPKFTVRLLIIFPSELLINVGRIRRLDNESVHQGNVPPLHTLDGDPGADDIIASFSRRPNGIPTAFLTRQGSEVARRRVPPGGAVDVSRRFCPPPLEQINDQPATRTPSVFNSFPDGTRKKRRKTNV